MSGDAQAVPGVVPVDAFVAARLAEDEIVAREAGPDAWQAGDRWVVTPLGAAWSVQRDDHVVALAERTTPTEVIVHVARHDPARVLDDVAAKRRVHDAYRRAKPGSMNRSGLTIALKALACAWSDHPDFDASWRA